MFRLKINYWKCALLLLTLLMLSCISKTQQNNRIAGKWQSYKRESRDKSSILKADTLDGWLITDKGEHTYYFNNKPYTTNQYVFKDNAIYFGGKKVYEVEKLTETELVVVDLFLPISPSKHDTREYFRRVSEFPEMIK